MKVILSSRRHHYVARVGIFLIAVALIAGTVGCASTPTPQHNLTIASSAGGSVITPGEGTSTYDEGAVVNLVATTDSCYYFVNWTGDVSTVADVNAAATTITMNGDYSITANFGEEETVVFADSNLEAVIREAIGIPMGPMCPSNLGGLTYLWAVAENITDLTGLEYATNLTDLVVANNTVSDISPLANLTSLTHLDLWSNQISDISPLANLMSLTGLWLEYNQTSDISPLANLTNLEVLYLGHNQISDISPVANLTNLWDLNFPINSISDISVLANLTNLGHLNAIGNMISDISPLVDNEGLSQGDTVWLLGNPLSSDSINIYIPELEARGVIVDY